MDRFQDMTVFVAVVEAGGFTAAAQRLGLAKSIVSRRMSELENRLGVRLFHRTTRRVSVTESGQAYYERCARILSEVVEAEDEARQLHGALRGRLRIAAPMSFGTLHLSSAIADFMNEHPALTIEMNLDDRLVDLVSEGYDVAVRISRLKDSSLIARHIAPCRLLVCASPTYLERRGVPETPDDLRHHDGLCYSNQLWTDNWKFQIDGEARAVKVPSRLAVNNGEALRDAAIAGLGVVALPTFMICDQIRRGELQPILANYPLFDTAFYAVYAPNRHLSAKVRAFVDYLVQRFGPVPEWDRGV